MSQSGLAKKECAVCFKPSTSNCSKCRLVYYCSKEHQQSHWVMHKDLCYPVKLVTEKSRNVEVFVAKRDIHIGQTIFVDFPMIIFPMTNFVSQPVEYKICMGCCKPAERNSCSKCCWPVCNKICEEEPFHAKLECPVLARNRIHFPNNPHWYNSTTLLRALCLRDGYPEKWNTLLKLPGHNQGYKKLERAKTDHKLAKFFILQNCKLKGFDGETIEKVNEIIDVNVQIDRKLRSCAKLEWKSSKIARSCIPNIRSIRIHDINEKSVLEKMGGLKYMALSEIKKNELLKLPDMISRGQILGTYERRHNLFVTYHTGCECRMCADPTELDTYLSCARCSCRNDDEDGSNEGYYLALNPLDQESKWKCNKCSSEKDWRIIRGIVEPKRRESDVHVGEFKDRIEMFCKIVAEAHDAEIVRGKLKEMFSCIIQYKARIKAKLKELHPNHYIITAERVEYLWGLYAYLSLNQRHEFPPGSISVRGKLYVFYPEKLSALGEVTPLWRKLNEEMNIEAKDLLGILERFIPHLSNGCGLMFHYLTYSGWMLLMEDTIQHQDYTKFLDDLIRWSEFKRRADQSLRVDSDADIHGAAFIYWLREMDRVDPTKNSDTCEVFRHIIEGNSLRTLCS